MMRLWSAILLVLPVLSQAAYVHFTHIERNAYAWTGYARVSSDPSDERLMELAWDAYEDMVEDAPRRRINTDFIPWTMSAGFYPSATEQGGNLVFHSSIKGGSNINMAFINSCNLNGHQAQGNCAEMSNMVRGVHYGYSLRLSKMAVFGRDATGHTQFLSPCTGGRSRREGRQLDGCRAYISQVGHYCVTQRNKRDAVPEAEPELLTPEKRDALAEAVAEAFPEANAEPKKSKSPKAGHSKTSSATHSSATHSSAAHHSSGAHASATTGGHATATKSGAADATDSALAAACHRETPDPKLKVTVDLSKASKHKVDKNTKEVSEESIIKQKEPQPSETGKAKGSATGKTKATTTHNSAHASATGKGKARGLALPRRQLLEKLGL